MFSKHTVQPKVSGHLIKRNFIAIWILIGLHFIDFWNNTHIWHATHFSI